MLKLADIIRVLAPQTPFRDVLMIAGGSQMAALLRLTVASEQLRPEILAGGAVTEPELAAHAALLDDPAVALMGPVMMTVWGRRPLL